ncbi:hypothetical protein [Methylocystis sp.]|uniref:hypothetical protein n=1 Tax=Methylocystis sp. TaxID=1911079 RepID=UPI0027325300|nr:hypothetical protein [Methylocystis sp.]MDP3554846.1 hypothetical protein [Methylocystis sp.]
MSRELGLAAIAATDELLDGASGDVRHALLLMDADCVVKIEGMANFIAVAGDVPGESLYRWSGALGLHPLPADGWANVSPEVRLFFDAFVAVVKALAPVIEPPQRDKIVSATQERKGAFEPAYEPLDKGDARTYADAPGAKSTGEVFVSRPGPLIDALPEPEFIASSIRLAAMAVDDATAALRAKAYALPGDAGEIINAEPPDAPAIGATELQQVSGRVGDAVIEGKVAVARPTKEGKAK